MSESKYENLPCKAEIVIDEQLFRYALSNHLSGVGYNIATGGFVDLDEPVLADCCTIDGEVVGVHFYEVTLSTKSDITSRVDLGVLFEDGLSVIFSVMLKVNETTVEQMLRDPFARDDTSNE